MIIDTHSVQRCATNPTLILIEINPCEEAIWAHLFTSRPFNRKLMLVMGNPKTDFSSLPSSYIHCCMTFCVTSLTSFFYLILIVFSIGYQSPITRATQQVRV